MAATPEPGATAEAIARESWARLLAVTASRFGDLDLAEDALADAFAAALDTWPRDGVPANPEGWLVTTARRKALDQVRRGQRFSAKLQLIADTLAAEEAAEPEREPAIADDRLRLVFTCCHPALARPAQVALALRYLCGLRTEEIARLFLVPEATMAARLTRAKKKIATAGIPYRVPAPDRLAERLGGVLAVVYLVFSEGYAATTGPGPVRAELCDRAVEMARLVTALLPAEPEGRALLALLLLQDSRRGTRLDAAGHLVLLPDQDRSRWDAAMIAEGLALLASLAPPHGPYALQAAIAAEHARAVTAAETDWAAIVRCYDALLVAAPGPVVALNRAVAVAMATGPAAGLALLDDLVAEKGLAENHLLPGARADLLRRLGRAAEATAAYTSARDLARTDAERAFYTRALTSTQSPQSPPPGTR